MSWSPPGSPCLLAGGDGGLREGGGMRTEPFAAPGAVTPGANLSRVAGHPSPKRTISPPPVAATQEVLGWQRSEKFVVDWQLAPRGRRDDEAEAEVRDHEDPTATLGSPTLDRPVVPTRRAGFRSSPPQFAERHRVATLVTSGVGARSDARRSLGLGAEGCCGH